MCISLQSSSSIAVPLSPLPPLPAYSSYSYSYADPHLSPFVVPLLTLLLFYPLPVHAASCSPSPSTSRHLVVFYLLPKSIPIRQRLHSGGSTAGTGPSRKDSLKRQPTPMPVAAAAVTAVAIDLQLCFNLAGYTLNSSRLSNSL